MWMCVVYWRCRPHTLLPDLRVNSSGEGVSLASMASKSGHQECQCTAQLHGKQKSFQKDGFSFCVLVALFYSGNCIRSIWRYLNRHCAARKVCLWPFFLVSLLTAACVLFLYFLLFVYVFEHVRAAFACSFTWQPHSHCTAYISGETVCLVIVIS